MHTESVESLTKKILDQYNRTPEGWRALIDGKGNLLVLGPQVGYRLKLISLNPKEYTGVGVKLDRFEDIQNSVTHFPSYGFRPLSHKVSEALLKSINQTGSFQKKLITKIFNAKPVPTWDLEKKKNKFKTILSGPIINHPNLSTISKRQKELDIKLAVEADKLFRKKFPHRAEIYR